jgi:sporulation protein YlmC with PRC-barrel domain
MMRTLLTTTALVALLSTGALAQDAAAPAAGNNTDLLTQGYSVVDTDGLASKLLGFPVYNSPANDAERIGEINDLVIGEDGGVSAVIIGVGGFLGIGEKNVAVNYDDLQWTVAEDDSERIVLEGATKEQLEAAVAVEMIDDEPMDTAAAPAADQPADAMAPADDAADVAETPAADQPADAMAPADDATDVAVAPAPADATDTTETGAITADPNTATAPADTGMDPLNRETLVDFDETTLTAEQLLGTNVYGPTDEHIGVIGDFVLGDTNDNAIDAVIIDFGGFLGIGTKEVAVGFEDLQFYADENGENRSLILNVTREQMEAAPAFNRDTYAAERDMQRIVVDPAIASAG